MASSSDRSTTYRDAGVDIGAGAQLVEEIKPLAASTRRAGVLGGLGGFAGAFDIGALGYRDPILLAATDGVGTKLKLAIDMQRHDTVGIDLVAMCVNDLVVQGAEPLFFLDYFAIGHLDVAVGKAIVSGIAEGCRQAGCALIGGETAEMPGLYGGQDYDLAGFAVGAVERDEVIEGSGVAPGDVVIGLPSSGLHSNGFSLVRHVLGQRKLNVSDPAPFAPGLALGAALLEPTVIYVAAARAALAAARAGGAPLKAMAHITGGGIPENLPRMLPPNAAARINLESWTAPPVFAWLAEAGGIADDEMLRTFNCGIGFLIVCAPEVADTVVAAARETGSEARRVGGIEARAGDAVVFGGDPSRWVRGI